MFAAATRHFEHKSARRQHTPEHFENWLSVTRNVCVMKPWVRSFGHPFPSAEEKLRLAQLYAHVRRR
jgi:hypothetical protein